MKNGAIASLLVVAILASAGAGYLTGYASERAVTEIATETSYLVTTTTMTSFQTQTNTTCTTSGPAWGVLVQVVTDSGEPISGVVMKGASIYYCAGGQPQVTDLGPSTTNLTGWVSFTPESSGDYNLFFSRNGTSYELIVPTAPLSVTYVAFHVPSGIMTSCIDGLNNDCLKRG